MVAIRTEHSDLQIVQIFKVALSFDFKVCKDLKDNGVWMSPVAKWKVPAVL